MPTPRQQYTALRAAVDELAIGQDAPTPKNFAAFLPHRGAMASIAAAALGGREAAEKGGAIVTALLDLLGELVDVIETLQGVPHGTKERTKTDRHR